MEIKVIMISKEGLTKENIISKMNPYVKEYLKKMKKVLIDHNLVDVDFRETFEMGENMTDEQFNVLRCAIPEYYLYIDPGSEEEWVDDNTIIEILRKFNLVVFWTAKVKRHPIDQFIQHVHDNRGTFNYKRVSNEFDYSHITLAEDYGELIKYMTEVPR